MKRKFINAALVLGSFVFTLVLAELVLRAMLFSGWEVFSSLRDPSAYAIYPRDENEDFHDDNYWKLTHLFSGRIGVEDAHPLLGWTSHVDRESLEHIDRYKLDNRRAVLLYGDSFADCMDSTTCFEAILNNDPAFSQEHFLLNHGVWGYGVDQISLLFDRTHGLYSNPFVVFSMLTTDLDRSMLSFRDSQKPRYRIEGEDLVLDGTPLKGSTGDFVKEHPPRITSYLYNRFRNSRLNPWKRKPGAWEKAYVWELKQLNRKILEGVFEKMKEADLDGIVLLFSPVSHPLDDWRLEFLTGLCEEHGMPYVRDRDIRFSDALKQGAYAPERYMISGDGHPTPHLNRLISEEIRHFILGGDYESYAMQRDQMKQQVIAAYYNWKITSDEAWLQQVNKKALEKGISLDSMVTLDALYMAGKHLK